MDQKKKPRHLEITFALHPGTGLDLSVEGDFLKIVRKKNGRPKAIEEILLASAYKRPKNSKIINQVISKVEGFELNHDQTLIQNYNMVFAADTNYIVKGHYKICVACLSVLSRSNNGNGYHPIMAMIFRLQPSEIFNPERFAWLYFMDKIINMKSIPAETKFAFIVDSELNKLTKINWQLEPIFAENLINQRFTLMYASADAGKEFISNQLLSSADKAAKELLNALIDKNINPSTIPGTDSPHLLTRHPFSK